MGESAMFLWAAIALGIGALIGWLLASARHRSAMATARTDALQGSTALQVELSSLRERASRIPDLELRYQQVIDALAESAGAAVTLREAGSRLTAELAAERDNHAALRLRVEETEARLEAERTEARTLSVCRHPLNLSFLTLAPTPLRCRP